MSTRTPALPVVRRSQAYLVLIGAVAGMLVAGLAVPLVFGETPTTTDSVAGGATDFSLPTDVPGSESSTATTIAGSPEAGGPSAGGGSPNRGGGTGGTTTGGRATPGVAGSPSVPGASGGPAPAGGQALTATDRGVTAESIRLGFVLLDIATVGRLGVNVAIDPEQQQAAFASFVADVNARGGIHGRKIEAFYRAYDVTDRNDQIAACRELTQEKKVFAVLGGFNIVDPNLCVVEENQTPMISSASNNPDWLVARAQGRLVTFYPRSGRMMAALVAELERVGLASKRIGILTDGLNDPGGEVSAQLQQLLEERGHKVVYRGQLDDDISTAASQVPIEVNRMQTAGGTGAEVVVFLASNAVFGTQFVNQANTQNYHPAYVNTDWASNSGDTTNANMPQSYEGAIAFTFNRGLSTKKPTTPPPQADRCRDVYNARSGRTLENPPSTEYGLTMSYCDDLRLFEVMATAAGPQLTRDRLRGTVGQVGAFEAAAFSPGALMANKFDVSDLIRSTRWGFDCKCWHPVDSFHRPGG